jgi:hypothetical protein
MAIEKVSKTPLGIMLAAYGFTPLNALYIQCTPDILTVTSKVLDPVTGAITDVVVTNKWLGLG